MDSNRAFIMNIVFPFHCYTKHDLIKFCYGDNPPVDSAIPLEFVSKIQKVTGNLNAHHWYVMDYTVNKAFGTLVNLKEKFFNVIANQAVSK